MADLFRWTSIIKRCPIFGVGLSLKDRSGAYVIEATVILPVIVLCVLSLGYFTQVTAMWENCVHCALDESGKAQAMAWDGVSSYTAKARIEERLKKTDFAPSAFTVSGFAADIPYRGRDHVSSYTLSAHIGTALPLGFSREFEFSMPILYRGFTGREMTGDPLGIDGLENGVPGDPAYVFPAHGRKYHNSACSYVSASVKSVRLNERIRQRYSPCSVCHSGDIAGGDIVFCFENSGTAYHRASCRTINRHVIVMDKGEAAEKGYTPCSKCGGM